MGQRRSFPAWLILPALALLVGGYIACSQQIGDAINNAALWDTADGKPLDHAGDRIKCPLCAEDGAEGVIVWQRGYDYRCDRCGRSMQARYDAATGRFDYSY